MSLSLCRAIAFKNAKLKKFIIPNDVYIILSH